MSESRLDHISQTECLYSAHVVDSQGLFARDTYYGVGKWGLGAKIQWSQEKKNRNRVRDFIHTQICAFGVLSNYSRG